jgi:hypothetical protein
VTSNVSADTVMRATTASAARLVITPAVKSMSDGQS